jgi:hypothetical protein
MVYNTTDKKQNYYIQKYKDMPKLTATLRNGKKIKLLWEYKMGMKLYNTKDQIIFKGKQDDVEIQVNTNHKTFTNLYSEAGRSKWKLFVNGKKFKRKEDLKNSVKFQFDVYDYNNNRPDYKNKIAKNKFTEIEIGYSSDNFKKGYYSEVENTTSNDLGNYKNINEPDDDYTFKEINMEIEKSIRNNNIYFETRFKYDVGYIPFYTKGYWNGYKFK